MSRRRARTAIEKVHLHQEAIAKVQATLSRSSEISQVVLETQAVTEGEVERGCRENTNSSLDAHGNPRGDEVFAGVDESASPGKGFVETGRRLIGE